MELKQNMQQSMHGYEPDQRNALMTCVCLIFHNVCVQDLKYDVCKGTAKLDKDGLTLFCIMNETSRGIPSGKALVWDPQSSARCIMNCTWNK